VRNVILNGAQRSEESLFLIDREKGRSDPMATAQELIKGFKKAKTIPHIALRVCQLISREHTSIQEIEEVIKLDPVLVSCLLRIINSPHYGLRNRVDSISRAVAVLGLKNLRNLVFSDALKGLFLKNAEESMFSRKHLWMHCTAVGVCGEMISRRLLGTTGEDAFLAGILHDIGMMVEDQAREELFLATIQRYQAGHDSFLDCERETIGTDHCAVGRLLAIEWKFPDEVQKAIRNHHTVIENVADMESLEAIVQVAHYITSVTGYSEIPERVEQPVGMVADHLRSQAEEYRVLASDFSEEMEKVASLYEWEEK